jgi:tRNA U34 2-thiouridine synthase MnmA/TrmU
MHKAIALFSGGLDSSLAILAVLRQGIAVRAVRFLTPFDLDIHVKAPDMKTEGPLLRSPGFEVEIRKLDERFLTILKNPKHGYGKNMNPCIDCRILMLKETINLMEETGAGFIISGEVVGQRPMSQKRDMLYHIDKEAGVPGRILRPLCAKLLRITIPEQKGIINREMLYDFSGRSRKPQMALAKEFGLDDYPIPAGGCLLTEPNFSLRLKDLLAYNPSASIKDIELLKTGRHFRLSPVCKVIVGRDSNENETIEHLAERKDCQLRVETCGSPTTLVTGEITAGDIVTAAAICARYSDAKALPKVDVTVLQNERIVSIKVAPAEKQYMDSLRIAGS